MKSNHRSSQRSGLVFRNARVVTPESVLPDACVILEDGIIREIASSNGCPKGLREIDAQGRLLLPGFVDIHSDVIETAIQPRPGGQFPVDVALHELDKQLVACGVTTIFHCLCFLHSDENPPFRNAETTDFLIGQIHTLRGGFKAGTYVHVRYEITNNEAFDPVETLIRRGRIHFFSIMDHTPGQGQFAEIAQFRSYYAKARGLSKEHMDAMIERRLKASQQVDWHRLERLAQLCREKSISIASHDDDSVAKVERVRELGATLSEFPVNMEAASAARRQGMFISLGSPNVLRGASLTGNLSGREALAAGLGDILCSDYAPMTLLHAALKLFREQAMGLPQAVRLISLNPAKAAGIDQRTGSIEPGKAADLVMVDDSGKVPVITRTLVNGREVFNGGDR
jgi:alpha-D-ribose 1-methylphosphonate 5-triphosphate diphosphatase